MTIDDLKTRTLDQVDRMLRQGVITPELAEEYCQLWNTTAFRFTEASVSLGKDRIIQRNLD